MKTIILIILVLLVCIFIPGCQESQKAFDTGDGQTGVNDLYYYEEEFAKYDDSYYQAELLGAAMCDQVYPDADHDYQLEFEMNAFMY